MAKNTDKARKRERKDGAVDKDIAKAESRLAKALSAVEKSREKLAKREKQLIATLERHGRLPAPEPDTQQQETAVTMTDNHMDESATVQLFDQQQVVVASSNPDEHEDTQ